MKNTTLKDTLCDIAEKTWHGKSCVKTAGSPSMDQQSIAHTDSWSILKKTFPLEACDSLSGRLFSNLKSIQFAHSAVLGTPNPP